MAPQTLMLLRVARSAQNCWPDFQTFRLGELCLVFVGCEEQFAFKHQRTGYVKQIDGSGSQAFGVSRGKLRRAVNRRLHVQHHVEQCAPGKKMFQAREGSVPLPRNMLALAGRNGATLVKSPLKDRIANLQCMQRQKEQ